MFDSKSSKLIDPYGGKLVDLLVPAESYEERKDYASRLPSVQISPRSVCDLELLATGAYSPLDRFMDQEDHRRVLNEGRLADGQVFPIPITLPVENGSELHLDQDIALRNHEQELMAIMTVEEIYAWDQKQASGELFTSRGAHQSLVTEPSPRSSLNISGPMQILNLPRHYDFQEFWLSPAQARDKLAKMGRKDVVAHQPVNALGGMHEELLEKVIADIGGSLLLQLAVGMTRLGDIDHYTQVRLFSAMLERTFPPDQALLSLLPLPKRVEGPGEAVLRILIHRNYGANHIIMSRNHASATVSSKSSPLFGSDDGHELIEKFSQELGVRLISNQGQPEEVNRGGASISSPPHIQSGYEHRKEPDISTEWYRGYAIGDILAEINPPRHEQGVCIWFTGLSGSGKSTTAEMLTWLLLDYGRRVTVLDGDIVRTHLSKGLGFSKQDRDTNVRRIGFVASELVRHGAMVICAVVSPYRAARNDVRHMVGRDQFVEVYVDTPLAVCEQRDVKGYYAKARRGEITGFTGIDDPYEAPHQPEIKLDTVQYSPQENAGFIIEFLSQQGFIRAGKKEILNKVHG